MPESVAFDVVHQVLDRRTRVPRWVVLASFIGIEGGQARCIEYRVRVVPDQPSRAEAVGAAVGVEQELSRDAANPDRNIAWLDAASSGPAAGIPRYVFEEASQARLLEKARLLARTLPEQPEAVRALLERETKPRRGRPPVRSLREKLEILVDIEDAYAEGRTLADVASDHAMSRSAVRDLLGWARSSDSGAVLFTGGGPGKKGGRLTPTARALLTEAK